MSEAYDFVRHVMELAPVFTARPGGEEFSRPYDWQLLTREGNADRIDAYRKGHAVMVVLGERVAVIDVDTKAGASIERTRDVLAGIGVRIYAEIQTPSGGRHFYVAGHPELPTVHYAEDGARGLLGLPGVEILSYGTNAFLPGTTRAKYDGAGYTVISDDIEKLIDGGDDDSAEALVGWVAENRVRAIADDPAPAPVWDGTPPDARQRSYLAATLEGVCADLARMKPESGRNTTLNASAYRLGRFVAGAGMDETAVIDGLYRAAEACELVRDDGERQTRATIASGLRAGKSRPRAVPESSSGVTEVSGIAGVDPAVDPVIDPSVSTIEAVAELIAELRTWQHLPDPTHVLAVLAAASTRQLDGEPVWLLLVAPPSSGKTETVRLLDDAADAHVDEITPAGLLGWSRGRRARPIGVLSRVGDQALVTFGDLSTLLATSDRGGRDQVFSLLRRAYDGHVTRDVSPPASVPDGPEFLSWRGRLTMVAAVTGAIDRYSAHAAELGPRWIYVRLPERANEAKRRAADLARRGTLKELRRDARAKVKAILERVGANELPEISDRIMDEIVDVALVTCWGRGAVPRHGYGRREIDGLPVVEEPMRLVQQLHALARGLLALGLVEDHVVHVVRRVALDSMPEARRAVLAALSLGEILSTRQLAKEAGLHPHVARFNLEELAEIRVVEHDRQDDEDEDPAPGRAMHWSLRGDDGDLIARVFAEHRAAQSVHEMLELSPVSPRDGGRESARNASSTLTNPTLRAHSEPDVEPDVEPPCPCVDLPPGEHYPGCSRYEDDQ